MLRGGITEIRSNYGSYPWEENKNSWHTRKQAQNCPSWLLGQRS
jgi:hypothetical protein